MIRLQDVMVRDPRMQMRGKVNFELKEGENIVLLGENGSGKSRLISLLKGSLPLLSGTIEYHFPSANHHHLAYKNIAHITFRSEYGGTDFFFQQRWNSTEYQDTPLVQEVLNKEVCSDDLRTQLYDLLSLNQLLARYVIQLSSGELRRFHLAQVLLSRPQVLIVENPFVGLDSDMRVQFSKILDLVVGQFGISLIAVCSNPRDIPSCTTHYYRLDNLLLSQKMPYKTAIVEEQFNYSPILPLTKAGDKKGDTPIPIVEFRDITLKYGERQLFNGFSWTINQGECWWLSGANGSGKTTLLSLITADNPQAYAQDIALFGRQRGTGESIWEIKRHIGFVSPEILRGYLLDIPALTIVASGFFDTIGLYAKPNDNQINCALEWMRCFQIEHLASTRFVALSSGEQRLVLLARAFVKEPDLLILDEPLHEIDARRANLVTEIIKRYCSQPRVTLIYVSHYPEDLPDILTHTCRL